MKIASATRTPLTIAAALLAAALWAVPAGAQQVPSDVDDAQVENKWKQVSM